MARFLTTHQIAGLLGVSERTVANWIDRGHLDAFRTPGGHRRVSPANLRSFLVNRGIPIPEELSEETRILIVEDDALVADALKGYLNADGNSYHVATISDGVSALIHIGHRKPHVVLLDILMPGMDGLEVCRKIRGNSELGEVKVVFVTGSPDIDPVAVKRETGAAEVLLKPVSGEQLRDCVTRVLRMRQEIAR